MPTLGRNFPQRAWFMYAAFQYAAEGSGVVLQSGRWCLQYLALPFRPTSDRFVCRTDRATRSGVLLLMMMVRCFVKYTFLLGCFLPQCSRSDGNVCIQGLDDQPLPSLFRILYELLQLAVERFHFRGRPQLVTG